MKKTTAYIFAILTVLAVGSIIFFVAQNNDSQSDQSLDNPQEVRRSEDTAEITQKEAISQAEAYQTEQICAQVLTPAVHRGTKARYTFPNSCMPDGWQPETDPLED